MSRWWMLGMLGLVGCASTHGRCDEVMSDAGSVQVENDASSSSADSGPPPISSGSGSPDAPFTSCGWNTCAPGEVCCSVLCGICAPPGSCAGDVCIVREPVVCGTTRCDTGVDLCCPTCDGDVCAPPGLPSRDACPAVECP